MKARYLLDTNMCIYLMKRQPPEVAAKFATCYAGDVVMSVITLAELRYGVECSGEHRERNHRALNALLEDIPAAPFDGDAADAYGPVRMATRERNRDALDKLIAAHSIALGAVLVTNNEKDFAAYPGLKTENWLASG